MFKDNFYYILKDRLEYAQDYLIDTSAYIQSVKFQDKVEREFFKDKKILYLLLGIINLPSDIIRYYQYFKSLMNYKRAEKEIQMLKEELSKYEQKKISKIMFSLIWQFLSGLILFVILGFGLFYIAKLFFGF
tara:strand:+ start:70 stop:465 length:396 start_codon:yes stop_codon:yes gene_type:complete